MSDAASLTAPVVVIGISGTLMGAPMEALALGMLAAVISTLWKPCIDSPVKVVSAIAIACFLAGFCAPPLAEWCAHELEITHTSVLQNAIAVVFGSMTPHLFPAVLRRAKKIISGDEA